VAPSSDADKFDVVFCDTCIGGSTVAANLARPDAGLRGFFLADYAVNPLGTRADDGVRAALNRWIDIAASRSSLMIVACNTASVRLEDSPDVRHRADEPGLRLHSMVDLLDALLAHNGGALRGRRVCVMGTEYTVSRSLYRDRLLAAGASEVIALGATRTERAIAHLQHATDEGRRIIHEEIHGTLADVDAVLLACTCFPLIGDQVAAVNADILQLDPGGEIRGVVPNVQRGGPNRLTLAFTGGSMSRDQLAEQAPRLFRGWDEIEVVRLAD
jgi:glutamate racemase